MLQSFFTEKDEHGDYFLLESIVKKEDESTNEIEDKFFKINQKLNEWHRLLFEEIHLKKGTLSFV